MSKANTVIMLIHLTTLEVEAVLIYIVLSVSKGNPSEKKHNRASFQFCMLCIDLAAAP